MLRTPNERGTPQASNSAAMLSGETATFVTVMRGVFSYPPAQSLRGLDIDFEVGARPAEDLSQKPGVALGAVSYTELDEELVFQI